MLAALLRWVADVTAYPDRIAGHLVLDNDVTRKGERVKRWLLRQPRCMWHFIRTHASWLDLGEGPDSSRVSTIIARVVPCSALKDVTSHSRLARPRLHELVRRLRHRRREPASTRFGPSDGWQAKAEPSLPLGRGACQSAQGREGRTPSTERGGHHEPRSTARLFAQAYAAVSWEVCAGTMSTSKRESFGFEPRSRRPDGVT